MNELCRAVYEVLSKNLKTEEVANTSFLFIKIRNSRKLLCIKTIELFAGDTVHFLASYYDLHCFMALKEKVQSSTCPSGDANS